MPSFIQLFSFAGLSALVASHLVPRDNCRTTTVQNSGDLCSSLASTCGITVSQLETYNPQSNFCNDLQIGQIVCCTSGSLPTPQPSANGTCATYTAQPGDYCAAIAGKNGITVAEIDNVFNNETWAWNGCDDLQEGQTFCISTGSPPMPAVNPAALCGPQVPGTPVPSDMSTLASLNPCPLNACCDKWGQCGTTAEFCTISNSTTKNPGTSAPGQNGCISNCGTLIIPGSGGASRRVGYFESFNVARPCLNMDASQLMGLGYTTVHYGFGELTTDFQANLSSQQQQWETFLTTTGFEKVVSFGGWAFSTDPSTYNIFRTAVTAANRDTFAQNIADFVSNNNLDGVDFDWEYPGAPDIPGIPPGNQDDGANYLAFLTSLRSKIATGKTISIAAPASYWYLKQFPIANISHVVDYIVFMTYDLHGQWDYGNKFADEGCPQGSCLRSHVNLTETINSLSMITKAGVDASKVVVGTASYGRSFQMTDPSCTGPECTFTGPQSGATPGECTQTAGYISNAELFDILANDTSAVKTYDEGSGSWIMTYGDNWVAFMDQTIMKIRSNLYAGFKFGGTTEWAIDLANFWPPFTYVDGKPVVGKGIEHGPSLTNRSTCSDLENWYGPGNSGSNYVGSLSAAMWVQGGVDQYFSEWVTANGSSSHFVEAFLAPWGDEESMSECTIDNLCGPPNCNNLDNYQTKPGTADAYMVQVAMSNLLNFFHSLYEAVMNAETDWALDTDAWTTTFDPQQAEDATDLLSVKEGLNGLATSVGIAAALLGLIEGPVGPIAGAVAGLIGGIVGGVNSALPSLEDTTIAAIADLQTFMKNQFTNIKAGLNNGYVDYYNTGTYKGVSMQTLFQDGAWLNSSAIGALNVNLTIIDHAIESMFNAIALDWSWSHQRVWLMSYPMSQDEYDSTFWYSGDNDFRLRAYYKGRGYFYMSVFPQQNGAYTNPRIQNPPGWGNLSRATWGFDSQDVIIGSANTYAAGGYNYTIGKDFSNLLQDPDFDLNSNYIQFPGIFTVPVCALDPTFGWTPTLEDFKYSMAGPGALYNYNDDDNAGKISPFCYCLRVGDGRGGWFDNFVNVGGWDAGSNGFCPGSADEFNTPGGKPLYGTNSASGLQYPKPGDTGFPSQ